MKHLVGLFGLLLLLAQPVWAFRCGNDLVEVGQYKRDVSNRCGEPESIDTHLEKRMVNNNAALSQYYGNTNQYYPNASSSIGQQQYFEIDIVVEEWFYNFGRNRFQQLLRFENGKLVEIKELGYGR